MIQPQCDAGLRQPRRQAPQARVIWRISRRWGAAGRAACMGMRLRMAVDAKPCAGGPFLPSCTLPPPCCRPPPPGSTMRTSCPISRCMVRAGGQAGMHPPLGRDPLAHACLRPGALADTQSLPPRRRPRRWSMRTRRMHRCAASRRMGGTWWAWRPACSTWCCGSTGAPRPSAQQPAKPPKDPRPSRSAGKRVVCTAVCRRAAGWSLLGPPGCSQPRSVCGTRNPRPCAHCTPPPPRGPLL